MNKFLLTLILVLSLLAFPTYAAQQPQWKAGHMQRAAIPTAKDLAVQRALQLKPTSKVQYVEPPHPSSVAYYNSPNWSGYMVGSGSDSGFAGVEGHWIAPCSTGTNNQNRTYSSWVGLGGYYNAENLEQAGIALQPDGTYRLWWEYYPDRSNQDEVDIIHCGDPISAFVHAGASWCSNGGFQAHVRDDRTGAHWGTPGGCITETRGYGTRSAEWIDERPYFTCRFPALADFNMTRWSSVLAQANAINAPWENPNSFVNNQWLMYDSLSSDYLMSPDGLRVNSDNTFTDRWYNYGIAC